MKQIDDARARGAARGGEGRAREDRGGRVDRRPLAARAAHPARREPARGRRPHCKRVRVAALADVHGNATALEAVLAELEREQPDLIVSCGDLTWGALPRETLALLEPWGDRVLFVRGNSERELARAQAPRLRGRAMGARASRRARRCATTCRTRPHVVVDVDGLGPTLFCHGSPRSDEECVTVETPAERVAEFMAGVDAACVVTAHTHMQYDRRVGATAAAQPGQRRPAVRARAGLRLLGAARARTSSSAGRRTTSTRRSSGCEPRGCRSSSRSRS